MASSEEKAFNKAIESLIQTPTLNVINTDTSQKSLPDKASIIDVKDKLANRPDANISIQKPTPVTTGSNRIKITKK